jgi:hypothetical protein
VGQRRLGDPLKLVCTDKINRGESFCRLHWPFTVCVSGSAWLCWHCFGSDAVTFESHPVKDTHSSRIEVKPKSNFMSQSSLCFVLSMRFSIYRYILGFTDFKF